MSHKDSGWKPKCGLESYRGHDVWEYECGPHEVNQGEVDGVIEFEAELKDGLRDRTR
ncbi:hypothetical protein [Halegenticoccus soli]|uniref:hypothetical protein n=1 Tax=Halegenticoccus soli TaxID=1985678 RepID=UPI0018EBB31C|nr:hypothetical protein [Halegenticoccus soli]